MRQARQVFSSEAWQRMWTETYDRGPYDASFWEMVQFLAVKSAFIQGTFIAKTHIDRQRCARFVAVRIGAHHDLPAFCCKWRCDAANNSRPSDCVMVSHGKCQHLSIFKPHTSAYCFLHGTPLTLVSPCFRVFRSYGRGSYAHKHGDGWDALRWFGSSKWA